MRDNQCEYNGGACGALNQGKLPALQQEGGTTASDNQDMEKGRLNIILT